MSTKKPSSALVPLDQLTPEHIQTSTGGSFDYLGKRAREEFDRIHRDEALIPVRGVVLGCIFAQVRAACDHGEWGPWVQKHFGGKKSTVYDYISIAAACVREKKIVLPEVLSLPQLSLELEAPAGSDDAKSALKKIKSFVGDQTLRELREKYRKNAQRGGATAPSTKTELQLRQERAEHFASSLMDEEQRKYFQACELDQQESLMAWWPTISTLNEELLAPQPAYAALPQRERLALATALKDLLARLEVA